MAAGPEKPSQPDIVAVLRAWRQADCSLDPASFVSATGHTVGDASEEDDGEPGFEAVEVHGLVVLTQTCDIVQVGDQRSLVHVAPLVEVDDDVLQQVARGRRISYAYVPGVAARQLVVDLSRVMTMSKAALVALPRVDGCRTDDERRQLSQSLARKFARTAFPDDFVKLIEKLRRRIVEKHARNPREGERSCGACGISVSSPRHRGTQIRAR